MFAIVSYIYVNMIDSKTKTETKPRRQNLQSISILTGDFSIESLREPVSPFYRQSSIQSPVLLVCKKN